MQQLTCDNPPDLEYVNGAMGTFWHAFGETHPSRMGALAINDMGNALSICGLAKMR